MPELESVDYGILHGENYGIKTLMITCDTMIGRGSFLNTSIEEIVIRCRDKFINGAPQYGDAFITGTVKTLRILTKNFVREKFDGRKFIICNQLRIFDIHETEHIETLGTGGYTFFPNSRNLMYMYIGPIRSIKSVQSWLYNSNAINLFHIEFTNGVEIIYDLLKEWNPTNALDASSRTLIENPSICSNNLEQFLYNFREYIVKRMATKQSLTYINLHTNTKSYIEGDYAKSWIVPGESQTYYASLDLLLQEKNWGLA